MTDGHSSTTVAWLMKLANDIDALRERVEKEREERREETETLRKQLTNLQQSANNVYTNLEQSVNNTLRDHSHRMNEMEVNRTTTERELRDLISTVESFVHRHKHAEVPASSKNTP